MTSPARHVAGETRDRSLNTSATTVAGTVTLRDRDGATIAGPVTLAAGVAAIACPDDALGGGYTERWAVTLDGEARVYVVPAIVAASDLDAPVSPAALESVYPIGLTSSQAVSAIEAGWARVLLDIVQRTRARMDAAIVSPGDLAEVCLYAAAAFAATRAGALTGGVSLTWHTHWEMMYDEAWRRIALVWDTDGTGTPGTDPERQHPPGFPGPSPQGVR
jgi:hypothetical protein